MPQHLTIDDVGLSAAFDGVVIESGILGLEQRNNEHLNFVSSCAALNGLRKPSGKPVFVSEEAHRLLSQIYPKTPFLSCRYMHPLTLGHVTVELLPSGESFGSSMLLIRKNNHALLYASHWSLETCPFLRNATLRKTDTVLFRFESELAPSSLTSKHECERLQRYLSQEIDPNRPVQLVIDPVRDAPRLIPILIEHRERLILDESVVQAITLLTATLPPEMQFDAVTQWKKRDRKPPKEKAGLVVLAAQELEKRATLMGSVAQVIFTSPPDSNATSISAHRVAQTFHVSPPPSLADVLRIVHETEAKEVVILNNGSFAPHIAQVLRQHSVQTSLLSTPQTTTLF